MEPKEDTNTLQHGKTSKKARTLNLPSKPTILVVESSTIQKKETPSNSPQLDDPEMAKKAVKNNSWFTPKRLLIIFCVINMINYVDRGAIGSNGVNGKRKTCTAGKCTPGTGIQGDFNLTNFEDGVLSSAFMVGLLVASPIFASLAKSINPFRLIGVGLSVWTAAIVGCSLSFNFWFIAVCRMLVGVGEASFISLAAPFIDDNAPAAQKTAWLATFYMCIPAGVALGYVYGGVVGDHLGWRYAFWGEAILMCPFAIGGFLMKPLQMKGIAPTESKKAITSVDIASTPSKDVADVKGSGLTESEGVNTQASDSASAKKSGLSEDSNKVVRFLKDMKVLLTDRVFIVNVLGYIAYNFVIGAYSYWGPKAGYNIYHMKSADMTFGGLTIVCGIVGTLAGGFILDRMNATISNAFKLLTGVTFFGAGFCLAAFWMKNMYIFIGLFAVGELLVFATQAPVNYVCLHCVTPGLRPLSMAMSTVAIHIFGDVPSSPLVGVLQDHVNNWRKTALILTAILFLAAFIWLIGIFLKSVDLFYEAEEMQASTTDKANRKPLLGNPNDVAENINKV